MKLLAFNNDAQLKADLLVELKKHRKADEIIKGTYGNNSDTHFRGCAVGCSINSYNVIKGLNLDTSLHSNYEKFGIPKLLARLEDSIFEGLPSTHNLDWPINFMSAINVGADLSIVWPKFAQWLMTDEKYGVLQYAKTDAQKDSIQKVSDLYKNGGSKEEFILAYASDDSYNAYASDNANANADANASYAANAAAYTAYTANASYAADNAADAAADNAADAADYAAYASADADDADNAAAYAADSSADAADNAADDAADAADAYAYPTSTKRFEIRIEQSEYLIKLLKECK